MTTRLVVSVQISRAMSSSAVDATAHSRSSTMGRPLAPIKYKLEDKIAFVDAWKLTKAAGVSERQFCDEAHLKRGTFQLWVAREPVIRLAMERSGSDKRRTGRAKKATIGGSERVSVSKPIEDQLLLIIKDWRREEQVVTREHIIDEAKALLPGLLADASDAACEMWCARFMKRNELTIRRVTHSGRIARDDLEQLRLSFVDTVAAALSTTALDPRRRLCVRRTLFNMDQTAIYANNGSTTTVEVVGARKVPATSGTNDSVRCTVALTVCADGRVLQPHFVFKGTPGHQVEEEVTQFVDASKVSFSIQRNAWFDEIVMLEYVDKVWKYAVTEPSVMILDSLKVHKMESVISAFADLGTAVVYVPGGATGVAQPLDVGVMAPFKLRVRKLYSERRRARRAPRTAAGKRKDMYERAMESLSEISSDTVINAFDKAGQFIPEGPAYEGYN